MLTIHNNYLVSMYSLAIYTIDGADECGGLQKVLLCFFIYDGGFISPWDVNYNNPFLKEII